MKKQKFFLPKILVVCCLQITEAFEVLVQSKFCHWLDADSIDATQVSPIIFCGMLDLLSQLVNVVEVVPSSHDQFKKVSSGSVKPIQKSVVFMLKAAPKFDLKNVHLQQQIMKLYKYYYLQYKKLFQSDILLKHGNTPPKLWQYSKA